MLLRLNKSISKGSAKLNISQSAISRQIQDLEFDLKTSHCLSDIKKGSYLQSRVKIYIILCMILIYLFIILNKELQEKKTKPTGKLTN